MKLALVDNLVMPEEGSLDLLDLHPHLGLLALAAAAETDGHSVRIYDPKRLIRWGKLPYDATLYERVGTDLLSQRPDAVGFTTLGCSFIFALSVAAWIKEREPDLPILLGGPHATMLHRQILERFRQFDVIVRHEADEIFGSVLAGLTARRFDGIPGVSFRKGSSALGVRSNPGAPKVEVLDRLPLVSYDHYPVLDLDLDLLRVEAGRGCPFACTFCSTASFFQRSYRLKSAERLVLELDRLHERYAFRDFKLDHDLFTVNRHKVLEFCEAVKGRGYRWRASARVDCVDSELLEKMAGAGCVALYFGIETGSARMQQIAKKRLDLALVEPTLELSKRLGITATSSFITGYPEEHGQDQDDTLDLLGRCFDSSVPQLHVLAPEPGTALFNAFGHELQYDGYTGPYNARLLDPKDEASVRAHPDVFPTYHYYPAAMPRSRYTFAADAVDVLRRVGATVLRYALRFHGGRLSEFVRGLREQSEALGTPGRASAELVEVYLRERFGPRHHLTSLFRYALRANARPAPADRDVSRDPAKFDPGDRYRLNSRAFVLSDLHDYSLVLERIQRETDGLHPLPDDRAGERGVFLLVVTSESATSYRIDSGVAAILSLFESPRSSLEVRETLRSVTGKHTIEDAFFAELVQASVLVPAESKTFTKNSAAVRVNLAHA